MRKPVKNIGKPQEETPGVFTRDISLSIRPKCVQSTRMARGHAFVAKDVREWKKAVLEQLQPQAPDKPCDGPVRVMHTVYTFKMPDSAPSDLDSLCELCTRINGITVAGKTKKDRYQALRSLVGYGYDLPYLAKADLKDNLNKGLMDCLTGLFFIDDSQVWEDGPAKKVYGLENRIDISLELTYLQGEQK